MKMLFLLPYCFIKNNKRRSISIFISMVLSIGLIVAVSSLMYSTHENKTNDVRNTYGDYHYRLGGDENLYSELKNHKGNNYILEGLEKVEIKDATDVTDNYTIVYTYASDKCRKLIRREIEEGNYPEKRNEIAIDRDTLRLLKSNGEIGSKIEIKDTTYVLSGIIEDSPEASGDSKEVYVSADYPAKYNLCNIYIKFSEEKDIYNQVIEFAKENNISDDALESNGELIECVIDSNLKRFINIVKAVNSDDEANFVTFLMRLKSEMHLTEGIVSFFALIFSGFIIYSIFSISVTKRIREYSILQTIGITRIIIIAMLAIELASLLIVAYPIGVCGGILFDILFYRWASDLFSGNVSLVFNVHSGAKNAVDIVNSGTNAFFFIDKKALIYIPLLMVLMIVVICLIITNDITKKTIMEMKALEQRGNRKHIFHRKKVGRVSSVLSRAFVFGNKSRFIAAVLSISIGFVFILSVGFVAQNTRQNNMMVMHSQSGLSSDIKVSVTKDEALDEGISEETVEAVKDVNKVTSVSAYKYCLGEMCIDKKALKWKEFWPEIAHINGWNQTADIMERFNGIVTENDDSYRIKTNIYGYDTNSLSLLKDYVIDGEINQAAMESENKVILRTLIDAQNNHDGLDIKVGDTIQIKTIKEDFSDKELLKFDSDDECYTTKEYTVGAIVGESLVSNDEYIGSEGLDIIMTNNQMKENYNLDAYNILAINKDDVNDIDVLNKLEDIFSNSNNIYIYDNALTIEAKNREVERAEILIDSIAIMLIIVAIFNIINIVTQLLDSKRQSIKVMQAIGISNKEIRKMLLHVATIYTISTCAVIFAIEYIVQRITRNMLVHVYGYLNKIENLSPIFYLCVVALVATIFIVTVLNAGKKILDMKLIEELKAE